MVSPLSEKHRNNLCFLRIPKNKRVNSGLLGDVWSWCCKNIANTSFVVSNGTNIPLNTQFLSFWYLSQGYVSVHCLCKSDLGETPFTWVAAETQGSGPELPQVLWFGPGDVFHKRSEKNNQSQWWGFGAPEGTMIYDWSNLVKPPTQTEHITKTSKK